MALNTTKATDSIHLRSYQTEMLEESIRRNIIVAMDTGSGKTHIAIARAGAALETCPSDKRVWFLAPTIALCEQQFAAFQKHLPAYQAVVLTGNDNVEKWNVRHWDAALKNQRIVLSTYQVLLQALEHAFVRLSDLALIIFDEAHHAKHKHPAGVIMAQHYHPSLASGMGNSPAVLGLTASPVVNAKANALKEIEANLNSQVVVPKKFRSELLQHVHPPVFTKEIYNFNVNCSEPPSLQNLQKANLNYEIEEDPYVAELVQSMDLGAASKLSNVIISENTWCRGELKQICSSGTKIFELLGSSPLELYLSKIMSELKKGLQTHVGDFGAGPTQSEKEHLLTILSDACRSALPTDPIFDSDRLSYKLNLLVDILVREAGPTFMGIIFVQERVTVGLLGNILSLHPKIQNSYRIGTFVGTSANKKRKRGLADSIIPKNGPQILAEFRSGEKNLMIATDVLEEGIDIPILNTVICFEPPKNHKSFIQRRGRARQHESKYIILLPELGPLKSSDPEIWRELEQHMRQAYEDEEREAELARRLEETDEPGERIYRVQSTGALLTLDNAMAHLQHFCDKLALGPYVNQRPQFSFAEEPTKGITAEVILPIAVDAAVRKAKSLLGWKTEKKASKDAAFQAYVALHTAGLVNDNLLPIVRDIDQGPDEFVNNQASFTSANSCYDPWTDLSYMIRHDHGNGWFEHRVTLRQNNTSMVQMTMLLPIALPQVFEFPLYWNNKTMYIMKVESLAAGKVYHSEARMNTVRSITRLLLAAIYRSRMPMGRTDFCALFVPHSSTSADLDQWLASMEGKISAKEAWEKYQTGSFKPSDLGLVRRDLNPNSRPFIFRNFGNMGETGVPAIAARAFLKRRDFHHKIQINNDQNDTYTSHELLDAKDCYFDKLPWSYSLFAAFVPALLHQVEIRLVTQKLQHQISGIGVSNNELILEAMTHSAACEAYDYQRLEFIGDCFLKYLTSLNLMAQHLNWPEGFLTNLKGRIVSNGPLKDASLAASLDSFIMATNFTGANWRPHYVSDFEEQRTKISTTMETRMLSSKVVADVVESLIGAALIDGGVERAQRCVEHLLNNRTWLPLSAIISTLLSEAPDQDFFSSPPLYLQLEAVLGYSFNKKSLALQAVTHGSFGSYNIASAASYERLEFLGDAVLDFIVVNTMVSHSRKLSHMVMHTLRTAVVNADLLAFLCMHFSVPEQRTKVSPTPIGNGFNVHEESKERRIWHFLRYAPGTIPGMMQAANARYTDAHDAILHSLDHDSRYPWALLAHLNAPKLFSDIIESILGAIFIDSQGSLPACEAFLERIGLLPILRHFLHDGVDCLHPKERMGQMADQEEVKYVRSTENGSYRASIRVGDGDIGCTAEGLSRIAADTEAATRAIEILERREHSYA